MVKFLIIDDHDVIRAGLKALLTPVFNPVKIYEACDGNDAIKKMKLHRYDIILMDIQMPDMDPFGLFENILAHDREAKVLVFSMNPENIYAKRFLQVGAKGFVSKDSIVDEIIKAINVALKEGIYISDKLTKSLALESFSGKHTNLFSKLSPREFEIATLLLSGQSVTDISRSLHLQLSTTGTHKARIFEKLGVNTLLELSNLARSFDLTTK